MDPICLVRNQNNQLTVNPRALKILEQISQPVVVVAIAGLYRTGKSYLMNRLVGQNHGFHLGSTVQSETKGIWMWCGDSKNDSWIFALAVLLSSTFIYNSMSTINHQALEQLHYVTELTELIRIKSSPISDDVEDSVEFVRFFLDFVWAVRDFMLELELNGNPITEDEYLENALKLIPDENPQIQNSNLPRECIRKFFPKRKCFVFDHPASNRKQLLHLEEIPENQLDGNFQKQSKVFCSYIYTHAKAKSLKEGITVTGTNEPPLLQHGQCSVSFQNILCHSGMGTLVEAYVYAINSGSVPCLENAVTILAQRENSAAVQKAADHYSEQMIKRLSLPTDTLQELLDVHAACEKEAIAVFMEHSFKDEKKDFQKKLLYCQAELKKLSDPLMKSISKGTFSVPGGHCRYLEARSRFEENYKLIPRKGVKANQVLQSFLQSQAEVEAAILQADQALTDAEKAMAEERSKRQAAEMKQDLLKQELNDKNQKMEAQERSHTVSIAQLIEKFMMERENLLREQEVLEHKSRWAWAESDGQNAIVRYKKMTIGYFQQGTLFLLQVQIEQLHVDFQKISDELLIGIMMRRQQETIRNENACLLL
ncbi:hypothetical protein FD754_006223 [Muntiacus muntjak]|uniref:GB1/RHD3-type G domain-containing protein n=1 Tax=Muntiacus muntjak TaxID=9888 RepID=A0A5N3WMC3_MUNMU|nr:hypothetical protein FD754_006223 [Muntiacus muntjak]